MSNSRILLVEDDSELAELFFQVLSTGGYKVDKFTDPMEACLNFEKNPIKYQLVISDVRMPGMSGFELIKRINQINRKVKVLLMSAFEVTNLSSELKEVSLEKFLQKPIHINQLLSTVENCLKANTMD
jgi:DNA-binding NtrC family response regulator